jgi:phosphate starvation-inducible protein PhoH
MKENLTRFEDETKFIMFTDLKKIDLGFKMGKAVIQKHLIKLYEEPTDV